jgi:hypothetical protein
MQFTICGAITVLLDLCKQYGRWYVISVQLKSERFTGVLAQRLVYKNQAPVNLPEESQRMRAYVDRADDHHEEPQTPLYETSYAPEVSLTRKV